MNGEINVVDAILKDRKGETFSAWFVYWGGHVVSLDYVRNDLFETEHIELEAA